jgi:hypothetical protein
MSGEHFQTESEWYYLAPVSHSHKMFAGAVAVDIGLGFDGGHGCRDAELYPTSSMCDQGPNQTWKKKKKGGFENRCRVDNRVFRTCEK